MIGKVKKYWEVFIIFLFSLTPLLWLKDNEIVIGHDSGFRLNYLDHLVNLFYSWNPVQNFGTDWGILKGFLIIQAPETFFSVLFGSLQAGQKASFVLWFFIIGISMYIFVKNFFSQKEFWIFRLFASIFYMYNFFVLQAWFIAERAKFSLIAALPLGTLIIYKTLMKEVPLLKGVILFSFLLFFLNGGGSPPLFGSLILVYLITFVYLTLINFRKSGVNEIFFSIKTCVFFVLGSLLINSYFVFTHAYVLLNKYESVLSSIGGISGILAWENAINKFASFVNLFRLQGIPDWYDNPLHPYSKAFIENPLLVILSFFPIFIIVLGLIHHQKFDVKKRKDNVLYMVLSIFIIGLIFAAGSHPPFGFIYVFLVEHLPGFAIFRSAFYKFGPVVWFSAIFLTGYYLNLLILKYITKTSIQIFLGILIILLIPFYHFPYFVTNFFEFSKPFTTKVIVPSYVTQSKNHLENSSSNSRILLLPKLDPESRIDSYSWNFWSLETLPKLSLNHSVVSNDNVSAEVITHIYKSIDRDDSLLTSRLLGSLGINKILWRGDVIYNDKKTISQDLQLEKDNINKIPGISLEKAYGRWEIFDVKSENYLPMFYSPKKIISSNSLRLYEDLLLNEPDPRFSAIFSIETENDLKTDVINKVSNRDYIEPTCILCKDKELETIKKRIFIPKVNFLPGSLFYTLKTQRENISLNKFRDPGQKIDLDVSFSNNRIAEISGVIFKDNINLKSKTKHIEKLIDNYKFLIKDASDQLKNTPEPQKNQYYIRVLSHLEVHRSFLNRLHYREGFSEELYNDLASFMDVQIANIKKDVWMSTSINNKRLIFNVTQKGMYDLEFLGDEPRPVKIILDGKEQNSITNINLNPEVHKLELVYEDPNLFVFDQAREEFALKNNEKKAFHLEGIKPSEKYTLSFEYKITEGDNSLLQASYEKSDGVIVRFDLNRDMEWKSFSAEFNYDLLIKDADNFILKNLSRESNVTLIRNLRLSRVFIPKVYITRKSRKENFSPPTLNIRKINPVKYVVSVKGATNPYVLNFNESFDGGWKVFIVKSSEIDSKNYASEYFEGQIKEEEPNNQFFDNSLLTIIFNSPLNEKNHFKTNGYSNAWYIEKTGDYNLIVFFEPQKYFYLGIIISGITIIGFFIIVIRKRYVTN